MAKKKKAAPKKTQRKGPKARKKVKTGLKRKKDGVSGVLGH
jgi:hypothetical protein